MNIRLPQFADDRWYPSQPETLQARVDRLLDTGHQPREVIALVAPHAGYFYSGSVAGQVYSAVTVPNRVIVIGVNHRGVGNQRAIMASGSWRIPGCDIPLDLTAAELLLETITGLTVDPSAHELEHSLEVQIPFLTRRNPSFSLVPICLGRMTLDDCLQFGQQLATAIKQLDGKTLLVASTDFNHYEPASIGNSKDRMAIEQILQLKPSSLFHTVRTHDISMCGVIPTTVVLEAALAAGATEATLIQYADSGDASGDKTQVVGYGGLTIQ